MKVLCVEMSEEPPLRGKAIDVGGDAEARHGIVLAKSDKTKAAGIKTSLVLWQAKMHLFILQPNYRLYLRMSRELSGIMGDYSRMWNPLDSMRRGLI